MEEDEGSRGGEGKRMNKKEKQRKARVRRRNGLERQGAERAIIERLMDSKRLGDAYLLPPRELHHAYRSMLAPISRFLLTTWVSATSSFHDMFVYWSGL
jgi:hypothetical protein